MHAIRNESVPRVHDININPEFTGSAELDEQLDVLQQFEGAPAPFCFRGYKAGLRPHTN